jgi:hypothetical protein
MRKGDKNIHSFDDIFYDKFEEIWNEIDLSINLKL